MDDKLDWKSLSDALKTRSIAKDSSRMLTDFGNLSSSSSKNFDNGKAFVNRLTSNKRSSYSNGDRNYGSSNDKSRDRYTDDSRDKYNNNNGSRNGSRNNSCERYRQPSVDRHRSNEVDASYSRHKSPDYRGNSSHEIVCYYCHRPGHIAMECRH